MGLRIGDSVLRLQTIQTAPPPGAIEADPRRAEFNSPTGGINQRRGGQPQTQLLFREDRPDPPGAGFGRGTVSYPTIALRTIDRNLEEARKVIPTLEEIQDEVRARIRREQERLERESPQVDPPPRFDLRESEARAVNRSRDLVNNLTEAASIAQARLNGEESQETGHIDVRIGEDTIPLTRQPKQSAFEILA